MSNDVAGTVSLMSPSWSHETMGRRTGNFVRMAGHILKISVSEDLGATQWRGPGMKLEADACFYAGQKSDAYERACMTGFPEAYAFTKANPPDLVIEIEG